LEEGRSEASDETVYKTVGEDAEGYDIYDISGVICGIKGAEGGEMEGGGGRGKKREGY
jgi:hypothetical protein